MRAPSAPFSSFFFFLSLMHLGKGASIKRLEGGALIKRLKEAPMTRLGKREQGKNNLKILEKMLP